MTRPIRIRLLTSQIAELRESDAADSCSATMPRVTSSICRASSIKASATSP